MLTTFVALSLCAGTSVQADVATPFTEESVARGIDYVTVLTPAYGYGTAFVDLDGDGDPDVVTLGRGDGGVGVYENDATGHFTARSETSGIPALPGYSGVSAGDYDADGDLDLFLTRWNATDVLLRNDGGFTFTDVTAGSGISGAGSGTGSAWGDIDGDGWLDLFVSNHTNILTSLVPNQLYRNNGDGTFTESLEATGMTGDGKTFHGTFFDLGFDGDPDLYISNDKCTSGRTNKLWENVGGTFLDRTDYSGTGACIDSMGLAVGDFDGDGRQDIYAANVPEGNPLYLNLGDDTFVEYSAEAGVASYAIGWAAIFFDFDHDLHQELYLCNMGAPNRLYDHDGVWPAVDRAAEQAVDEATRNSFGAAAADVDLDGDLDLLVSNLNDSVRLYINHSGSADGGWVMFRIEGQGANRFGIGTIVKIRTGETWQQREVIAGSNYKSQNELKLHFGVGDAPQIDEVRVSWPGRESRVLEAMSVNQLWTLYPPERLGDSEPDGDVDRDDFLVLVQCLGSLQSGCEMMDFNGNAIVDDLDFGVFMTRYTGPVEDCNGNGSSDLADILGGTSSDVNLNAIPDECETAPQPAGGLSAGPGGPPLTLTRVGAELRLEWSSSCQAGDTDYAVYEGVLGDFATHTARLCTTEGLTEASLTPAGGDTYYLVVPRNALREGSYGTDGGGNPRPPGLATCLPQLVAGCD